MSTVCVSAMLCWGFLLGALAVLWTPLRALLHSPFVCSPQDRLLLVTAHPDDESMFFSPTLLSLAEFKCSLFILCLSTGGGQGA